MWTGYTLNAAIGMQVLLGSLTTGLSALAVSGGKSVNIFLSAFTVSLTLAIISLKTAAATTALGTLFLRHTSHSDEFCGQWGIILI